jgi:hypothetical protein
MFEILDVYRLQEGTCVFQGHPLHVCSSWCSACDGVHLRESLALTQIQALSVFMCACSLRNGAVNQLALYKVQAD